MTNEQRWAQEVLKQGRPPLILLNWLDKSIEKHGDKTPADILAFREFWRKFNAGEAIPEIDRFDTQRGETQ